MSQDWSPPDRLGKTTSRAVRLTGRGIALASISALLVVGGFVAGAIFARTVRHQEEARRMLDAQGVNADAVITRVWRASDKSREPRVAYRFTYQDKILTHSVNVPLFQWRTLKEGAPLPIRFVPSRPDVSQPVDWIPRGMPAWVPYLFTGFLAGLGALLAVILARQMRLLAEGRAAKGLMTGFRRGKSLIILYEYKLPDGTTRKGRAAMSKMPDSTLPLCVLYDPENPKRSALYPLPMVRLEV